MKFWMHHCPKIRAKMLGTVCVWRKCSILGSHLRPSQFTSIAINKQWPGSHGSRWDVLLRPHEHWGDEAAAATGEAERGALGVPLPKTRLLFQTRNLYLHMQLRMTLFKTDKYSYTEVFGTGCLDCLSRRPRVQDQLDPVRRMFSHAFPFPPS
jgi:hypothetical protein